MIEPVTFGFWRGSGSNEQIMTSSAKPEDRDLVGYD